MSTPDVPTEVVPDANDVWREINLGAGNGMPPYLDPFLCAADKEEGRRAYCLALLMDTGHVLNPNWVAEVAKLEGYLKTGELPTVLAPTKLRSIGA